MATTNTLKSIWIRVKEGMASFTSNSFTFLILLLLLRLFEMCHTGFLHGFPPDLFRLSAYALLFDIFFWFKISLLVLIVYLPLYVIHKPAARVVYIITALLICIIHLALVQYFNQAMVPLGADFYGYKWSDIRQTVGAGGGVKLSFVIILLLAIAILLLFFYWFPKKVPVGRMLSAAFAGICVFLFFLSPGSMLHASGFASEFVSNEAINKTDFFFTQSYNHFFPEDNDTDIYSDDYIHDFGDESSAIASFKYVDEEQYPFLHVDSTPDVLSPFFNTTAAPPNIVILLVEGLGRAFTNEGAYLGNFTPFVDSLSKKSLYWENFLSQGGRTFAVLPSLLGSLPFAKNGFNEMGEKMPAHLSLLSLLKLNGYHTSFYYGGDSRFDNMKLFLHKNSVDQLNDESTFPGGYSKMPSHNGFSWGYGDKELFRRFFETKSNIPAKPNIDVILTVSTHSPFQINEEGNYFKRFEERISQIGFDERKKNEYRNYRRQYASILYTDDALKNFFNAYSKRSDFNNTIFILTGDHRMPEIPMSTRIDRYHVPLLIYSPLLKRTARFSSISSHVDITPSLLSFMRTNYSIKTPSYCTWIGNGLDTSRSMVNNHAYALMQTKNDLVDFVMGNNHLSGDNLYRFGQGLTTQLVDDKDRSSQLKRALDNFKEKNTMIINGAKLIPDSIYQNYFPR